MEDIIISLNSTDILSNMIWATLVFVIGLILSLKIRNITQNLLEGIRLNQATKKHNT